MIDEDEAAFYMLLIALTAPLVLVLFADGTLPFGLAAVALLSCFVIDAALVWSMSR